MKKRNMAIPRRVSRPMTKAEMMLAERACSELTYEIGVKMDITFLAFIIVQSRKGWGKKKLLRRLEEMRDIWNNVANSSHSIMQELADTTGLDMTDPETGKSWREYDFMNQDLYDGHTKNLREIIKMRREEKRWCFPACMAGVLTMLHKVDGYGPYRLLEVMNEVNEYILENGFDDVKPYEDTVIRETDIRLSDIYKITRKDAS